MEIEEFSNDGKLVFVFDQQLLIPEALKNYTLKTEAIQPDEQKRLLRSNNDTS